MEDCQHLDLFVAGVHYVDDAVIAIDHFANRFIPDLWHDAAYARETLKRADLLNYLLLEDLREVGSADALVVLDDGVEFVLRLLSKPDVCHRVLLSLL